MRKYKDGLNGFRELRTQSTMKRPLVTVSKPKSHCKICGCILREDNTMEYCSPCYRGEVDIPDILIEVAEEADYIDQIASLIRSDIMSEKTKLIYREIQGGDTEEG